MLSARNQFQGVVKSVKLGEVMAEKMVKVMDMGLALVKDAGTLTQSGGSFGTVDYVAPEQVADSHAVDVRGSRMRADVALLRRCLHGSHIDQNRCRSRKLLLRVESTRLARRADQSARAHDRSAERDSDGTGPSL